MDVVVRGATVADAAAAARVYVASAEYHHRLDPALYRVPAPAAVEIRYRSRLDDPDDEATLLVAELDGQVVGSTLVRLDPPPSDASMLQPQRSARIDVAVLPEHRGRGVGRALMQAGQRWAADRGARLLMLDCHIANSAALGFYERSLGFRRVGLLLAKPLAP